MSEPKLDELAEQLQDPEPKVRRKACRRLVATKDPQVLPFLRNAYLQDEDEQVHDIAHDGLAAFKAMQTGKRSRVNERRLRRIVIGLAVVFFVSLLLNVAVMGMDSGGDDSAGSGEDEAALPSTATIDPDLSPREKLIATIDRELTQAQHDAQNLRQEIEYYFESAEPVCEANYYRPADLEFTPEQREQYPELVTIADRLNIILDSLRIAQLSWDGRCAGDVDSDVAGALTRLNDLIDPQLAAIEQQLQAARGSTPSPAPGTG
jgi:hypothetical protein